MLYILEVANVREFGETIILSDGCDVGVMHDAERSQKIMRAESALTLKVDRRSAESRRGTAKFSRDMEKVPKPDQKMTVVAKKKTPPCSMYHDEKPTEDRQSQVYVTIHYVWVGTTNYPFD